MKTKIITPKTLFGLVLLLEVLAVFYVGSHIKLLSHDCACTLAILNHSMSQYNQTCKDYSNSWVPASTWQPFVSYKHSGNIKEIRQDLNQYDIHPPLYFWLLYLWRYAGAGNYGLIGLFALNIMLAVLTACLVRCSCQHQFSCSEWISSLMGLIWFGMNIEMMLELRQYCLLSFISISLFMLIMSYNKRPSILKVLGIITFAWAGTLTHYQFFMYLTILLFIASLILLKYNKKKQILLFCSIIVLVCILFYATNPDFLNSVMRMQKNKQDQTFTFYSLSLRIYSLIITYLSFVGPVYKSCWKHLINIFFVPVYLIFFSYLWFRCKNFLPRYSRLFSWEGYAIIVSIALILCASVVYLLFLLPKHAMGVKYLAYATPLLCIGMGQLWTYLRKQNVPKWSVLISTFVAFVTLGFAYGLYMSMSSRVLNILPPNLVDYKSNTCVIVDTEKIGVLLPIINTLPPDTLVLTTKSFTTQFPKVIPFNNVIACVETSELNIADNYLLHYDFKKVKATRVPLGFSVIEYKK